MSLIMGRLAEIFEVGFRGIYIDDLRSTSIVAQNIKIDPLAEIGRLIGSDKESVRRRVLCLFQTWSALDFGHVPRSRWQTLTIYFVSSVLQHQEIYVADSGVFPLLAFESTSFEMHSAPDSAHA